MAMLGALRLGIGSDDGRAVREARDVGKGNFLGFLCWDPGKESVMPPVRSVG